MLTIPAVFGEETIGFMQKREAKSGSLGYYGALHSNRQVAAGIVTKRQISAWNLWNSKQTRESLVHTIEEEELNYRRQVKGHRVGLGAKLLA